MNNLVNKMSQIFSDSMNYTNGRRILNAWCDMPNDIKIEVRKSMKVLLDKLIKDNNIIIKDIKNDTSSFKYLYFISSYAGDGCAEQKVYKNEC